MVCRGSLKDHFNWPLLLPLPLSLPPSPTLAYSLPNEEPWLSICLEHLSHRSTPAAACNSTLQACLAYSCLSYCISRMADIVFVRYHGRLPPSTGTVVGIEWLSGTVCCCHGAAHPTQFAQLEGVTAGVTRFGVGWVLVQPFGVDVIVTV